MSLPMAIHRIQTAIALVCLGAASIAQHVRATTHEASSGASADRQLSKLLLAFAPIVAPKSSGLGACRNCVPQRCGASQPFMLEFVSKAKEQDWICKECGKVNPYLVDVCMDNSCKSTQKTDYVLVPAGSYRDPEFDPKEWSWGLEEDEFAEEYRRTVKLPRDDVQGMRTWTWWHSLDPMDHESALQHKRVRPKSEATILLNTWKYVKQWKQRVEDGDSVFTTKSWKSVENVVKRNVAFAAYQNPAHALAFAKEDLKNDRVLVLGAVKNSGYALQFAGENLKSDPEIVFEAVQNEGLALQFAADELKNDWPTVFAAVKSNGLALQFAGSKLVKLPTSSPPGQPGLLKNDYELVFAAVSQNANALQFAGEYLKNDWNMAFTAVQSNGMALRYASDYLKYDYALVRAAVKANGLALKFAAERCQNDRDIVLEAVQKDGQALRYASEALRNDREIVLAAVKADEKAVDLAGEELMRNPEAATEIRLAADLTEFS